MKDLLDKINSFFEPDAHVSINDKYLSITVGRRSLEIELPSIVGASSEGESEEV